MDEVVPIRAVGVDKAQARLVLTEVTGARRATVLGTHPKQSRL